MTHATLIASLGQGNAGAFVGAGLSIGAGLPGWYDLIAELSARIGYDLPPAKWATGDALIDAAQAYVNKQGLNALIRHLKDRLDTTGVQPTAAHRALARLPIALVFTANFDDLLERAFRDAGKRVEVVVRDSSIPFMRRGPNVVNIVKLYGDLDQPDTIVLARQQYESYFLQRPQMVKLLETELARSDMLYLGWSGSDPYFKLVFGELLSRFGQMMRPGYAVMFDVTDAQRDELARRQIRPVALPAGDRTASLAAWLVGLTTPAALPSTPQVAPPAAVGAERTPAAAPAAGSQTTASGAGSVAIGGSVHNSVVIIGNGNVVGDGSSSRVVTGQLPGQAGARPAPAGPKWNTAALRDLLNAAFNDEELSTLCFDYFRPVYDDFAGGMSKGQKVQRLLDYCTRRDQVDELLAAVQKANPAQVRRFEDRLRG